MITFNLRSGCCDDFVKKWADWCRAREGSKLALLKVSEDYITRTLDSKSRNMVKKANGHLEYRTFWYNNYLDDVYEINTSAPERQGRPMSSSYLVQPSPIQVPYDLCGNYHHHIFYGGFDKQDTLRCYAAVAVVGDIAILNTILGHAHDKPFGIINGLIAYINADLLHLGNAKYINYLDLVSCGIGLRNFKESVGFKEYKVGFVY